MVRIINFTHIIFINDNKNNKLKYYCGLKIEKNI